jgi:protein-glutamine gamma-glutamyltransferase
MTTITRREFRHRYPEGLSVADASTAVDAALLDDMRASDVDGDGFVRGYFELNKLFRAVDHRDSDGHFFSIDDRGPGGDVVRALDRAVGDRRRIGQAMVKACEDMDRAKHEFALIKDQTFSSTFWEGEGGGTFHIKPGVRPSDALKDIFANPAAYKFECATALVIVHEKAMLDLVGEADFDRLCPKLRIGPWETDDTFVEHVRSEGSALREASRDRRRTLRAGDYGYFKNWQVSDEGRDAGWQGENVIALGDGRFYGHPFGITDEKTIVDHLNAQRRFGAWKSAGLLDLRMELEPSILDEDRVPG